MKQWGQCQFNGSVKFNRAPQPPLFKFIMMADSPRAGPLRVGNGFKFPASHWQVLSEPGSDYPGRPSLPLSEYAGVPVSRWPLAALAPQGRGSVSLAMTVRVRVLEE